jgi:branched-subunit amino acid aminotransferase/4-amino-4-deoxychorismate lyase
MQGVVYKITRFRMDELQAADEIFLVGSVFGLWSVREVAGYQRTAHPVVWRFNNG